MSMNNLTTTYLHNSIRAIQNNAYYGGELCYLWIIWHTTFILHEFRSRCYVNEFHFTPVRFYCRQTAQSYIST